MRLNYGFSSFFCSFLVILLPLLLRFCSGSSSISTRRRFSISQHLESISSNMAASASGTRNHKNKKRSFSSWERKWALTRISAFFRGSSSTQLSAFIFHRVHPVGIYLFIYCRTVAFSLLLVTMKRFHARIKCVLDAEVTKCYKTVADRTNNNRQISNF